MHQLAITLIGHDRPGIIADASEILAGLGVNLTDSTMTRLRGHFAMTLVCSGEPTAAEVEAALHPLSGDGSLLVTVREVAAEPESGPDGGHFVLSVYGADRLGIVASLTRLVAEAGGNVTDLTTRLSGELYVLIAEIDLPSGVDVPGLRDRLADTARNLAVDVSLREAEVDVL